MLLINRKLVIFLGFLPLSLFFIPFYPFDKTLEGAVTKVLDGDTIIVQNQKIRLYGIDAPELAQKSSGGLMIGLMSTKYLEELILGRKVKVHYSMRGYYGRIIGEVWLERELINLKILRDGMAIFSRYSKRRDYYLASYIAKLKRVGLFKTKGFANPANFRRKKATKQRL